MVAQSYVGHCRRYRGEFRHVASSKFRDDGDDGDNGAGVPATAPIPVSLSTARVPLRACLIADSLTANRGSFRASSWTINSRAYSVGMGWNVPEREAPARTRWKRRPSVEGRREEEEETVINLSNN